MVTYTRLVVMLAVPHMGHRFAGGRQEGQEVELQWQRKQ